MECRIYDERLKSCTQNKKIYIISLSHRIRTHLNVGIEGNNHVTNTSVLLSFHKQQKSYSRNKNCPIFRNLLKFFIPFVNIQLNFIFILFFHKFISDIGGLKSYMLLCLRHLNLIT